MNWLTKLLRWLLELLQWLLGLLGGSDTIDAPAQITFAEVDSDPVLLVPGSQPTVGVRAVTGGAAGLPLTGTLTSPDGTTTAPLAFRAALTTPQETSWEAAGPLPVAAAGSWTLSLAYGEATDDVSFTAEEPAARQATQFSEFDVTPPEEDAGTPIELRGVLQVQTGPDPEFAGFAEQPITLEFRYVDSFAWAEITGTVTGPGGEFTVTVTAEETGFWRATYNPPDGPITVLAFAAAANAARGTHSREVKNTARFPSGFVHVRIYQFTGSPSKIAGTEQVVFKGYLQKRKEGTATWKNYSGRSVGVTRNNGPSGADVTGSTGFFSVPFTPGVTGAWNARYKKKTAKENDTNASFTVKPK
jgi:hypothetical protein